VATLNPVNPSPRRASRGVGSQIALATAFTLAAFAVVAAASHLVLPAQDLPPPFPTQHQDAETLAFVFTFAI